MKMPVQLYHSEASNDALPASSRFANEMTHDYSSPWPNNTIGGCRSGPAPENRGSMPLIEIIASAKRPCRRPFASRCPETLPSKGRRLPPVVRFGHELRMTRALRQQRCRTSAQAARRSARGCRERGGSTPRVRRPTIERQNRVLRRAATSRRRGELRARAPPQTVRAPHPEYAR